MFNVSRGFTKKFSGAFLISNSLPAIDLKRLIKTLIFNSLEFKEIAFTQCPPFLAIPMIWNHLEITTRDSQVSNAKDDGTNYEESRIPPLKVWSHLQYFSVTAMQFYWKQSDKSINLGNPSLKCLSIQRGLHYCRKKCYSCDRIFMESSVQHCFFLFFRQGIRRAKQSIH